MNKLLALIDNLETKIPYSDKLNTAISQSPDGWHIQHTLLATKKIIQAIEGSNPKNYKWKFSLTRNFVFTFNKIPRGKGKAPKSVIPNEPFEPAVIQSEIRELKSKISDLGNLNANSYFDHPYFGNLNLKSTQKFLIIHAKHHLDIIDEIIK